MNNLVNSANNIVNFNLFTNFANDVAYVLDTSIKSYIGDARVMPANSKALAIARIFSFAAEVWGAYQVWNAISILSPITFVTYGALYVVGHDAYTIASNSAMGKDKYQGTIVAHYLSPYLAQAGAAVNRMIPASRA